jgi:S1-C subfamily serine protease
VLLHGLQGEAFEPKGWLSLEELGVWVKQRVFAESKKRQLPQFGNLSGEGQFVFVKAGAPVAALSPSPAPPRKPPPRTMLGVEIRNLTPELADSSGLTGSTGAMVVALLEGGPAAKAGLQKGDVVLEFDGAAIPDAAALQRAVAASQPGHVATLRVWRDRREHVLSVTLEARPEESR